MTPDEVISPVELARRVIMQIDALTEEAAAACAYNVPRDERETVCGSYLHSVRQATDKLRRWAPQVGSDPDKAFRFGRLSQTLIRTTREVVTEWENSSAFLYLVEEFAPGLRHDLEALGRVAEGAREELREGAQELASDRERLRDVLADAGTFLKWAPVVVVVGGVLYFTWPLLLAARKANK